MECEHNSNSHSMYTTHNQANGTLYTVENQILNHLKIDSLVLYFPNIPNFTEEKTHKNDINLVSYNGTF